MTDPQVKMLVLSLGYNAAAKASGIKAATLRKRAQREHWLRPRDKIDSPLPDPRSRATSHSVTQAHSALENTLRQHRTNTTTNLARYVERASYEASKHKKPLQITREARDIEGVRSSLWPNESNPSVLTLQVLNAVKVVRAE